MDFEKNNNQINNLNFSKEEANEIGKRLKEKRELKSLSIDEISNKIKVNAETLTHIENGEWERLSNLTIGKRLIRIYAKELDCDLIEFNSFATDSGSIEPSPSSDNFKQMVQFAKMKSKKNQGTWGITFVSKKTETQGTTHINTEQPHSKSKLKWIITGSAFGITALTVVGIYMLFNHDTDQWESSDSNMISNLDIPYSQQSAPQNNEQETDSAQADEPNTINEMNDTNNTNQITETTAVPPASAPVAKVSKENLSLTITSPVHIMLTADGKTVLNGVIEPNSLNFEFEKQATLVIEDSSKVKMTYAGWKNAQLSPVHRKRTIVLKAHSFKDM